jgi:acetyltransferase-like isoleucine patch superfamily enzyme
MEVFIPLFLEAGGPKTWDTWLYTFLHPIEIWNAFLPILQDPVSLTIFLTSPLVFIGIYLLKMFIYACIAKFYLWGFKLIHPRKELINALPRGNTAKDVGIYYNRNFILRMIKWEFSKSMFPWLLNWMYNFINTNKIGKNCTFEDGYVCQEYLETGKNVYVGYGTVTTSHLLEGIYGALILKKIKLADNVCIGSRCAIPPGTEFNENSEMLWYSGVIKYQRVKPGVVYWGLPASRLTKQKYYKLIKLPKEFQDEKKEKKDTEEESLENQTSNSSTNENN